MNYLRLFLVILASIWVHIGMAAPNFPTLSGNVVDPSGVLAAEEFKSINDKLVAFEGKSNAYIVLVIVEDIEGMDISAYGTQLAAHWKYAQISKNNGVLMVASPSDGSVTILFTNAVEGNMGQELARAIIDRSIIPRFEADNFNFGLEAGIERVIQGVAGEIDAQMLIEEKEAENRMWNYIVGGVVVVVFVLIMFVRGRFGGEGKDKPNFIEDEYYDDEQDDVEYDDEADDDGGDDED